MSAFETPGARNVYTVITGREYRESKLDLAPRVKAIYEGLATTYLPMVSLLSTMDSFVHCAGYPFDSTALTRLSSASQRVFARGELSPVASICVRLVELVDPTSRKCPR